MQLVRVAETSDIGAVCVLYEEFWKYNALLQPEYYKSCAANGSYLKSVIADNKAELFVAVDGGAIVGLLHVREAQSPPFDVFIPHEYAEIVDLIVSSAFRRKGIGTLLMGAAKQWGKSRCLDYIELFVLSEAKGEAIFYDHEGFKVVSKTMKYTL